MGSVHLSRQTALDFFCETVGYKAGLIVTVERLADLLRDYDERLSAQMVDPDQLGFRFHSTEVEDIIAHLLFKVGNIDDPSTMPGHIQIYHRVKDSPYDLAVYQHVMQCYVDFMNDVMEDKPPPGTALDPEPFMRASMDPCGRAGLEMAMEIMQSINNQLHISPWGTVRSVDWTDTLDLEGLFRSEDLSAQYGQFFDQRYIDYLEANFDQIGNIHWRKFEGLTGEFFDREGFKVDVGPGRNDDGIDLRIYSPDARDDTPPLMIVQCKRQKEKVGKTLVKSVYADVLHEKAGSGLIVTSSFILPGAKKMRTARNYPVEAADRDTLREWIHKMKVERI